jgi:hypothetical protein
MKVTKIARIAGLVALGVSASAAMGLPLADAGTRTRAADRGTSLLRCIRFDVDDKPACGIMRRGPRGFRGPRGRVGAKGITGFIGKRGPVGPVGPLGPTGVGGPKGETGPQGAQGIQGAPGHTVVVAGSRVVQASANGPMTGTVVGPTIARCPSGPTPEAYGGGVQITKSGAQSSADVVTILEHFAGTYNSTTSTVDPLPSSTTPGTVSTQGADAYLGRAVITQLNTGDSVTVQAYAVCGP